MSPTLRQSISTAVAVLLFSAVGWPAIEALCDMWLAHRQFTDALLLASLGAPGHGELPLTVFWVMLFGPVFILVAALFWKRRAWVIGPLAAIAGVAVAPLQWSIASHAYRGGMPNCISDVPGFTTCGLPSTYRITFAITGAIVGLLIGTAVARSRGKALAKAPAVEPERVR